MASVDNIIKLKAPNLHTNPDKATYIALAKQQTSACFYGTSYNLAVALRACHSWTLDSRNPNETGSLSGRRMGPVSVSFSAGSNEGSGDLSMTTYGRQLSALKKSSGPGISVLGAPGDTIAGACE